jgi:hypothetical protein
MNIAALSQSRPRQTTRFLGPASVAQWVKFTAGASMVWAHKNSIGNPIFFPNDFWGQVDVWIPPNTFTACGEDGNHDLFGLTAAFIDFGFDAIYAKDVVGPPTPDWRWFTDLGITATTGPAPSTTYTVQFHFVRIGTACIVDWYVNGTLVASDSFSNSGNQNRIFLNLQAESCCCEIYYYTNVKIGTTNGGTDIFQDDFSGGLGNWTLTDRFQPAAITLVSAPSAAACPTVTVSPLRGLPGQNITITGGGFTPSSPLTLFLNNTWIESFSASSDGSGNVSVTIAIPNLPTFSPYEVFLSDDQGNFACATLAVCGAIPADGISTNVADPLLVTGGHTDGNNPVNLILDYIFHDGAHWVLWQDLSSVRNLTTFPPPTNHTANVTRISADGSSVTDYPIDTNYQWIFGSVDTAFISGGVWQKKFWFTSWAKPILDGHLASDGTTLWVALLTRETIPYPNLSVLDNWGGQPNTASQFVPLSTLTSGFTSFGTSSGTGYTRIYHNTVGAINIYGWRGATSDNGDNASGHWSPPTVVVFAGGVGGFTRIGGIPAAYCPGNTDGYANANGSGSIIGNPRRAQMAPRGSLFSRVSLAASPNDPGRCHLTWSEGGDWGQCGITNGSNTAPLIWDGGPPSRNYRVNYTTWGAGGVLTNTDIAGSTQNRTSFYFLSNEGNPVTPFPVGYTWPIQANFGGLLDHDLRNDNAAGTPYLFAAWHQIFQNPFNVAPDTVGNPWLDNMPVFADTIHVYDLSSGGLAPVQALSLATLGPTSAELNQIYLVSPPYANPIGPVDSVYDAYTGIATTSLAVLPKGFGISLPYDDPGLGVPVYLVHLPLVKRFTPQATTPTTTIDGFPVRAFYRVPCDMSTDFDFLDGERLIGFTINREPISGSFPQSYFYSSDFFSDPKNIWVPAPDAELSNFNIGQTGYDGVWFDRVCANIWQDLQNAETPPVVGYEGGAQCSGFHYDPFADSITICTATTPFGNPGTPGDLFGITILNICRGCRSCPCGVGVHIAHRF